MAALVLSQRGTLKKMEPYFGELISKEAAVALRLAVIFAHARTDVELPLMDFTRTDEGLRIRIEEGWLNAHPLTAYLLREESEAWDKIDDHLTVEKF